MAKGKQEHVSGRLRRGVDSVARVGGGAYPRAMVKAYIGLGSNLGRRQAALREALERVGKLPGTKVMAVADFRETEPVGGPAGSGRYINGAAGIETELGARELLAALLGIERELGRVREAGERNGPRVIDLDLLLYGEEVVREAGVEIPHPRMTERGFVMEPLAEIAGEVVHPVVGERIGELWRKMREAMTVK